MRTNRITENQVVALISYTWALSISIQNYKNSTKNLMIMSDKNKIKNLMIMSDKNKIKNLMIMSDKNKIKNLMIMIYLLCSFFLPIKLIKTEMDNLVR